VIPWSSNVSTKSPPPQPCSVILSSTIAPISCLLPPNYNNALIVASDRWHTAHKLPVAHHHPIIIFVEASLSSWLSLMTMASSLLSSLTHCCPCRHHCRCQLYHPLHLRNHFCHRQCRHRRHRHRHQECKYVRLMIHKADSYPVQFQATNNVGCGYQEFCNWVVSMISCNYELVLKSQKYNFVAAH
jgi:hypothetical protein